MWFYKLTPDYVDSMPEEDVELLWQAMPRIQSEEMLIQMKLADYPRMKPEAKKTLHQKTWNRAYPESVEARAISFAELQGVLNGG